MTRSELEKALEEQQQQQRQRRQSMQSMQSSFSGPLSASALEAAAGKAATEEEGSEEEENEAVAKLHSSTSLESARKSISPVSHPQSTPFPRCASKTLN
jgi:hypothetical protein